jgi:hypothetical protein
MYKIPEDFDTAILKGTLFNQITFGLNSIILSFNEGFIQFSGGFSFTCAGKSQSYDEVYPVKTDSGLLSILDKKITEVSINNDRNELTIRFENECELCLYGSDLYESFEINIGERRIII